MLKAEDIKIGESYEYCTPKNVFLIIGRFMDIAWICWEDDKDLDTVYLNEGNLSKMKLKVT